MTERVPRLDTARLLCLARDANCTVIGPNTLGLIRPGIAKMGTIGGRVDNVHRSFKPGRVAILSRSGGMTTEIASFLTSRGIGQSIAIGVGGDPIIGSDFCDLLDSLEADPSTEARRYLRRTRRHGRRADCARDLAAEVAAANQRFSFGPIRRRYGRRALWPRRRDRRGQPGLGARQGRLRSVTRASSWPINSTTFLKGCPHERVLENSRFRRSARTRFYVRGYAIEELAARRSFGDIVYLLLTGELPDRKRGQVGRSDLSYLLRA